MAGTARHKCFISYHKADQVEVDKFIKDFSTDGQCLIYRAVREMDQNIIDSTDCPYVMRRIRELYLTDSTVTIILVGQCTWARRYVDWEIASTLRNDQNNKRSGLMGILLPSANKRPFPSIPPRFKANLDDEKKYARYYYYPTGIAQLTGWIEDAFQARISRAALVDNSLDLYKNNRTCP